MPRPMKYKMSDETREKLRKAQIKRWHGDDWTEEDQKEFVRKRNNRHSNNWRAGHRDAYNKVMRRAQYKFREKQPYYYGWLQHKRNHPLDYMSYENYIEYRKEKEFRRKEKEANNE